MQIHLATHTCLSLCLSKITVLSSNEKQINLYTNEMMIWWIVSYLIMILTLLFHLYWLSSLSNWSNKIQFANRIFHTHNRQCMEMCWKCYYNSNIQYLAIETCLGLVKFIDPNVGQEEGQTLPQASSRTELHW